MCNYMFFFNLNRAAQHCNMSKQGVLTIACSIGGHTFAATREAVVDCKGSTWGRLGGSSLLLQACK